MTSLLIVALASLFVTPASAKTDCPPAASAAAVTKAYPESKMTACKQEKEHGAIQYEVKIETRDSRKLELDVSPEGSILMTEEIVPLDTVPAAVTFALKAKYPDAKPSRAEKQTAADGKVTYEVALGIKEKGKKHEATFAADGSFVGDE